MYHKFYFNMKLLVHIKTTEPIRNEWLLTNFNCQQAISKSKANTFLVSSSRSRKPRYIHRFFAPQHLTEIGRKIAVHICLWSS